MMTILTVFKERFFGAGANFQKNKKRKGHSTSAEARRWKHSLSEYYRAAFGVKMHPLQSDPSIVPPFEVAVRVQAPNKSDPDTFFATGYRQTLDYFAELAALGLRPDRMEAILEFGVGAGRILVHYLPFKAKLHGCDVNPSAVEWTRKTLSPLAEIKLTGSAPPLPYKAETFDFIYANSVFTHIPFARHEAWVAELSRLLKPGGCLIASVHGFEKIREYEAPEGWYERNVEKGLHQNTYFSEEKLSEIWRPYFERLETKPYKVQTHVIAVKASGPAVRVSSERSAPAVQSVLHKARKADIVKDPFPHLVIPNALDPDLYARLEAEFPANGVIQKDGKEAGDNKKHFYGAAKALSDGRVSALWKDFFNFHLSERFYREVLSLFDEEIQALYPDLESRLKKPLKELKTGIRRLNSSAEALLDCQFAINTPVSEPSSVRGPHLDGPQTLYQCLLYFRNDREAAGGDLELYRFKEGVDLSTITPKAVDPSLVSKAAAVPYEKNTLIAFLNSPRSLHGVSPRAATPLTRRYFNALCDLKTDVYSFSGWKPSQSSSGEEY